MILISNFSADLLKQENIDGKIVVQRL